MNYSSDDFEYGPVIVTRGPYRGRVGELDDTTIEAKRAYGYVYFAGFGIASQYAMVPLSYLRPPNTNDLLLRHDALWRRLTPYLRSPLGGDERIDALQELAYVSNLLNQRMFEAQFMQKHDGAIVFLSHASADKDFVRGVAVDLAALGHRPWLDEWEILGGDSIPSRIADGLEGADFVVVVLSASSVKSKWVEAEWQAKHWDEVNSRHVQVVPLLLEDCEVPMLLKTKRYIDFRGDYASGMVDLARTLKGHTIRK